MQHASGVRTILCSSVIIAFEIIPDCEFRLDGGAMFGVVPRNLWSKPCPPDDQNRIRMNMNCLFIEAGRERILIDTGIGDKWSEKHRVMYGINRVRSLDESLKEIAGVTSSDITIVINTHLHFDHAGGNTLIDESGKAVPAFPNARYFVSRAEFEHAEAPTGPRSSKLFHRELAAGATVRPARIERFRVRSRLRAAHGDAAGAQSFNAMPTTRESGSDALWFC
jgi:glyoxylase-like metal-dependent hydrolase (beta-lactamase superfamily II)